MTLFSIRARLPVTKTAASSSDQIQAGTGDAQSAHRDIVGRDRHDVAVAIAANFGATLADERERFVDHDRDRRARPASTRIVSLGVAASIRSCRVTA